MARTPTPKQLTPVADVLRQKRDAARRSNTNLFATIKRSRAQQVAHSQHESERVHAELGLPPVEPSTPHRSGWYTRPVPYSGPKRYEVAARDDARHKFTVERNEVRHAPYGCFDVFWKGERIGGSLTPPDQDECMRLRAGHLHP